MVRSFCICASILFSGSILGLLAAESAFAQSTDGPASRSARSAYAVDGLALGDRVDAQSPSLRGYQCSPSEQFPEFTRCQRTQRPQGASGRRSFDSISAILHGADGKAVYINRYLGPWTFERGEIQSEINRLSGRFGERAREMRMPQREGLPFGIIAAWGQVELQPLDGDAVSVLASGESPRKGLLIDYLGDLRRSAQLGLPIYAIRGGAGYLWAGSADRSARGHIRFLTVDASALSPSAEKLVAEATAHSNPVSNLEPAPETKAAELMTAELKPQATASEPVAAQSPEAPLKAAPLEAASPAPVKAAADDDAAKPEPDDATVQSAADGTDTQQVPAPERARLDALFARVEAQLVRAEAANRALQTWAYRSGGGLVVLLLIALVGLRTWRKSTQASSTRAVKTETQSPAAAAAVLPQIGQNGPSLVPQDTSPPQPIIAPTNSNSLRAEQSDLQACSSCQAEIARSDKFCRHCGASSIAVASPSLALNGDAAEAAVSAALFGDAQPTAT